MVRQSYRYTTAGRATYEVIILPADSANALMRANPPKRQAGSDTVFEAQSDMKDGIMTNFIRIGLKMQVLSSRFSLIAYNSGSGSEE